MSGEIFFGLYYFQISCPPSPFENPAYAIGYTNLRKKCTNKENIRKAPTPVPTTIGRILETYLNIFSLARISREVFTDEKLFVGRRTEVVIVFFVFVVVVEVVVVGKVVEFLVLTPEVVVLTSTEK